MKFFWHRFNLYLLASVAVVGLCGCKSASSSKPEPKKLLATLRLHLEASWDSSKESEPVPILRDKPVMVKVEKPPFLTEGSVSSAKVVDTIGGFALRIQFDQAGTTTLDQYTTQNRGKRVASFSQFGKKIKDYRWLGAPVMNRRISDGVLTFTPDATREESEEIATGLNNVSEKVHTWVEK